MEQWSSNRKLRYKSELRVSANIGCDNNQERSSPACHYCHHAALQESTLLQSLPALAPAIIGSVCNCSSVEPPGLTFTEVLVSLFGWTVDWTVINDETPPLSSRVVPGSTNTPALVMEICGSSHLQYIGSFFIRLPGPAWPCTTACLLPLLLL